MCVPKLHLLTPATSLIRHQSFTSLHSFASPMFLKSTIVLSLYHRHYQLTNATFSSLPTLWELTWTILWSQSYHQLHRPQQPSSTFLQKYGVKSSSLCLTDAISNKRAAKCRKPFAKKSNISSSAQCYNWCLINGTKQMKEATLAMRLKLQVTCSTLRRPHPRLLSDNISVRWPTSPHRLASSSTLSALTTSRKLCAITELQSSSDIWWMKASLTPEFWSATVRTTPSFRNFITIHLKAKSAATVFFNALPYLSDLLSSDSLWLSCHVLSSVPEWHYLSNPLWYNDVHCRTYRTLFMQAW